MTIQMLPLRQCFIWLGAGWFSFKANPGVGLAMSLLFLVFWLLLGMLPFVGIALMVTFLPFLFAGLLIAAHKSLVNSQALVEDMFLAFNDERFRQPLLRLGSWMLAILLLLFITFYPVSWFFLKAIYLSSTDVQGQFTHSLADMVNASPFSLGLQLLVVWAVSMGLFYATPLLVFEGLEPAEAVWISLQACLKNFLPLTLFMLIASLMATLAIFTFGLGLLLLIPVLTGATYASFRDIFDPIDEVLTQTPST